MSDSFVTQLVTDRPHVAIIHDNHPFYQAMVAFCHQADLDVVAFTPDQITEYSHTTLAESYKIVWLVDESVSTPLSKKANQLLESLQAWGNKVTLVRSVFTPVTAVHTEIGSLFKSFFQALPKARFVFVQDVVEPHLFTESLLIQCTYLISQGILLDGSTHCYPQHFTEALQVVGKVLFDPRSPTRLLVRGPVVTTTQVVLTMQKVYYHYFGVRLSIQKQVPIENETPKVVIHTTPTQGSLDELLSPFVRLLPLPSYESDEKNVVSDHSLNANKHTETNHVTRNKPTTTSYRPVVPPPTPLPDFLITTSAPHLSENERKNNVQAEEVSSQVLASQAKPATTPQHQYSSITENVVPPVVVAEVVEPGQFSPSPVLVQAQKTEELLTSPETLESKEISALQQTLSKSTA